MTDCGKREEQEDLRDGVQEVDLVGCSWLTVGDVGEEGVQAVLQVSSWKGEGVCSRVGNHRANFGHTKRGCCVAFDLQCCIGDQI